jgi:hypothetical protein
MGLVCFGLLAASLHLPAQSFSLSSTSAAPGDARLSFAISLKSPRERMPVALQWELLLPQTLPGVSQPEVSLAAAARKAGKSVTCAGMPGEAGALRLKCILAGGVTPITDGPVASLRLAPGTFKGSVRIRLERGFAVMPDASEIPIKPVVIGMPLR